MLKLAVTKTVIPLLAVQVGHQELLQVLRLVGNAGSDHPACAAPVSLATGKVALPSAISRP